MKYLNVTYRKHTERQEDLITKDDIFAALETVELKPDDIGGLQITEFGQVQFTIEVDPEKGAELEPLRQRAEQAVNKLEGVTRTMAILTAQKKAPEIMAKVPDPHGMSKNPKLNNLPIKNIIAVASGKGGVGKSTVAVNLAYALSRAGHKVGLLDADIYGPSVPLMSGIQVQKPSVEDEKLLPLEKDGIKLMSIGFLTEDDQALIWRGPMVQTALYQMLRDVKWGEESDPLDVLVIDMPPGTGDAQLTLAQKVPVTGAVIVSTPQDLALIDARKAIEMFYKTEVPVLGLVENMSTYICSQCGHEEHIFGHGGAKKEAEQMDIPFLGDIPLNIDIRIASDEGKVSATSKFDEIAKKITLIT